MSGSLSRHHPLLGIYRRDRPDASPRAPTRRAHRPSRARLLRRGRGEGPASRVFSPLPCGRLALNFPVYVGATMLVHPRFDAGAYLRDISGHAVAVFGGAPPLFQAMLNHPEITHPAVANCTVVGKPDPLAGELPKAFIVLKPGAVTSAEEIMSFVAAQVTPYKKIREIEFVDEIPVSLAGKALKRELREREKLKAGQAKA